VRLVSGWVTALNIHLADLPGEAQENIHVVRDIYALRRHLWVEDEPLSEGEWCTVLHSMSHV
jgi:hypothetical protein